MNTEILDKLQQPDCDAASIIYGSVIEGFDDEMRLAIKACAVPERFDASIAKVLFKGPIGLNGNTGEAFSKVTSLPFTYVNSEGVWGFFPEARMFLLKELKKKDNVTLNKINQTLDDYYGKEIETKGRTENPTITVEQKRSLRILKAYHKTNISKYEGFDEIDKLQEESQNKNQSNVIFFRHFDSLDTIYNYGKENYYFYEGMRLYSIGERKKAFEYLKSVADSNQENKRVGIAAHLVGKMLLQKDSSKCETYFNKSLKSWENKRHKAQVLHSLGDYFAYNTNRHVEAEKHLNASLEIGNELNDKSQQAQVLHSLGNLLANDRNRHGEAEKHLKESLEIGNELNDNNIKAQVLHSLGNLLVDDPKRHKEAEGVFHKSIKANSDPNHTKKVYNSLASFYNLRGDYDNAIKAASDCLKILEDPHYKDNKPRTISYNEIGHAYKGLARFDDALKSYRAALDLEKKAYFKNGIQQWINETEKEKQKIESIRLRFKSEGWSVLEDLTPIETLKVMRGIYEGTTLFKDLMDEREKERKRDD
jgi:tetratricopeptide (TPR) repeat protein